MKPDIVINVNEVNPATSQLYSFLIFVPEINNISKNGSIVINRNK